ncbi:conserved hypothetical protein [Crenothrix polyspora]|uniref:DUF1640 domain-containing protein n=1 Tax=Crenothrix polyspora TaxID=360316 RepID=A0A1R4HBC7_9GAMM|nr:DUF1640 domain-containing protein [Crenothrix polyspora]SJM93564.1 conserved hypothetical protein [Crenothrix polyspora]
MATVTFDTHEFVKKLKGAGFSEEQAEILTDLQKTTAQNTLEQALHDYDLENITSKKDVELLELNLKRDIKQLEIDLKKDIEILRLETKRDIAESKAELIRWVVGVGILQTMLVSALLLKLSGMH